MKGTTHRIFGTAVAIGTGTLLGWDLTSIPGFTYLGTSLLASTVPDWDIKLGIKHRGITHYGITTILVSAAVLFGFGSFPISAGILAGMGSHLLGDMNTIYGVPLLAPFTKKRFRFPWAYRMPKDRSFHPLEMVILAGCVAFIFLFPWWR